MKNILICKNCNSQITKSGDPLAGDKGRQEVKFCRKKCRKDRFKK